MWSRSMRAMALPSPFAAGNAPSGSVEHHQVAGVETIGDHAPEKVAGEGPLTEAELADLIAYLMSL